jgi:soluble lytic murein transglycosylase-like protein
MRKLALVVAALGLAGVLLLGGAVATVSDASGVARLSPVSGIPAELLPIIEGAAGAYCDLPSALLAAVLKVESDFDNSAVNPRSGAFTMAQFLPGTWEEWKVNGNPDQGPTIDPADAADVIFSAARYLCGLGAGTPDTQRLALAAYHAGPRAVEEAGGSRTRPTAPRATLPPSADAARPPTTSARSSPRRPPMQPTPPSSSPPGVYSPG